MYSVIYYLGPKLCETAEGPFGFLPIRVQKYLLVFEKKSPTHTFYSIGFTIVE